MNLILILHLLASFLSKIREGKWLEREGELFHF